MEERRKCISSWKGMEISEYKVCKWSIQTDSPLPGKTRGFLFGDDVDQHMMPLHYLDCIEDDFKQNIPILMTMRITEEA